MNSRREVAKTIAEQGWKKVYRRGNFTVVIIYWAGYSPGVGIAKRNPSDEENGSLGINKAYGRALKDITDRVWEQRYQQLYAAGWISPGLTGTIGSNGAGKRLAQWLQDKQEGLATDEDFGRDLTPILNTHPAIWRRVDEA